MDEILRHRKIFCGAYFNNGSVIKF